jgi:predicted GNAT family N-acyltransferase
MTVIPVVFGTPEFDEMLALRYKVLREPLDMDYNPEQIEAEYDSRHLACYNSDWTLLGCLTLLPLDEKAVKMRQVAVAPKAQGRGVGRLLVEESELWARMKGYGKMEMHAREPAVPFYKKLHYHVVGERFMEVGIPHFKMEKKL